MIVELLEEVITQDILDIMIMVAIALVFVLSIFAFKIAIKTHFVSRWSVGLLIALGLIFIVYLLRNLHEMESADWSQILLVLGLVAVTGLYALYSAHQARASVKMAEEMTQQRISASQPVVWPMVWGWSSNELEVIFENIGNGPALDIDIYLGHGEEPIIRDCEHMWYSYMVAGDKKTHNFLTHTLEQSPLGAKPIDSSVLSKLVGKYTLLVEWRDLYKSGPFFQAKLPFSLEMDSDDKLYAKEGVVVIDHIPEKRKERQNTRG